MNSQQLIGRNLFAIRFETAQILCCWFKLAVKSRAATLRLKKGFIFAIVLISSNMLTGNNARQTKTVLFASRQRRRSPVSYAAILGPPSPPLLSSKLIIQLFYLAVCHLTQVLRVCLSGKKKMQPHYSLPAAGNKHAKCRNFNTAHKFDAVAFCPF